MRFRRDDSEPPVFPAYWTPAELAAAVGVTRRTVYTWLTSGRLKGIRVGVEWRITKEQFETFTRASEAAHKPDLEQEDTAAALVKNQPKKKGRRS
jgi:excisionase family DNA binding protein